jgi:biotin carboxyl carrier protein
MPGKVTRIEVKNGDSVEENDVLLVMEAMKMEHTIKAPVKGIVEDVSCTVGNIVNDGHVLLTVKN